MAWPEHRLCALLATLALAALVPASADVPLPGEECDDLRGLPRNFRVDWQADIKPILNEQLFVTGRCTSCHNPGQLDGGLDLTDLGIDAIYKLVPAYVTPGDPASSLLFDKINCQRPGAGGLRMPFGQAKLGLAEQALIHDWIAQGAYGEPEDEVPIARDFLFRDGMESLR